MTNTSPTSSPSSTPMSPSSTPPSAMYLLLYPGQHHYQQVQRGRRQSQQEWRTGKINEESSGKLRKVKITIPAGVSKISKGRLGKIVQNPNINQPQNQVPPLPNSGNTKQKSKAWGAESKPSSGPLTKSPPNSKTKGKTIKKPWINMSGNKTKSTTPSSKRKSKSNKNSTQESPKSLSSKKWSQNWENNFKTKSKNKKCLQTLSSKNSESNLNEKSLNSLKKSTISKKNSTNTKIKLMPSTLNSSKKIKKSPNLMLNSPNPNRPSSKVKSWSRTWGFKSTLSAKSAATWSKQSVSWKKTKRPLKRHWRSWRTDWICFRGNPT